MNLWELRSLALSAKLDCHQVLHSALAQGVLVADESALLSKFLAFAKGKNKSIKSQLLQDLFAAFIIGRNYPKTFLEFGATDGVSLSNSFMLDLKLGWKGAVCEPSPQWHKQLLKNRSKTKVLTDCIGKETGQELDFLVSDEGVLSTLEAFKDSDQASMPGNAAARVKNGHTIKVSTISLNDVMEQHFGGRAPSYVSVDTEGSEFEILNAFNFDAYRPLVFTVEHNFTDHQAKIDDLMERNGYLRIFRNATAFDAWYVESGVLN